MEKVKFDARQVDSWFYDDSWQYNASYHLFDFETSAKNEKRAFVHALNKRGIYFKKNKTRINSDFDCIEIVDRKTGEILFCAIPVI